MAIKSKSFPESSMIESVSYNEEKKTLTITFNKGGTYDYFPVPLEVWEEIEKSDSVGKTFIQTIKGKFAYERIS